MEQVMEVLSTRAGFNRVVRHIKSTISLVDALSQKQNLADYVYELGTKGEEVSSQRIALLLRMLLVDKLGYAYGAVNLEDVPDSLKTLGEEFQKWKAVDLVVAYYHPDMDLLVANPKDEDQLQQLEPLKKHELLVVYAGKFEKGSDELCQKAVEVALGLFQKKKIVIPEALYVGEFGIKKKTSSMPKETAKKETARASSTRKKKATEGKKTVAASSPAKTPAPATTGVGRRMTPLYSVVVQNELFHNGNVEAWKRIIESYKTKYPDLEVYIYYEGERIVNINSLFKWGKVKHGSTIQFAVAGENIRDVAKLQRYLMQGASPQFEAFLKGPVSTVLKLF
ncbi:MAG: hypothetical protein N2509_02445 [Treponemataceae bacterium]|uniref:hypothetical protein n=1 Tax=Treponema sp. J25 TaxID=2094121 RepID=UPI00104FD674|nr:hypothetical protein [Treponema sp. J25]MCX7948955.1 hypothetical protein [Treponemataceae bacterium]TCW62560.1 hypothetical protein C5O22_00440 [Treponema sp. J25]